MLIILLGTAKLQDTGWRPRTPGLGYTTAYAVSAYWALASRALVANRSGPAVCIVPRADSLRHYPIMRRLRLGFATHASPLIGTVTLLALGRHTWSRPSRVAQVSRKPSPPARHMGATSYSWTRLTIIIGLGIPFVPLVWAPLRDAGWQPRTLGLGYTTAHVPRAYWPLVSRLSVAYRPGFAVY